MPVRGSLILCCALVIGGWCCAPLARAITIDVRLMCEVTGGCGAGDFFIDHPEALTALDFAVQAFEPLGDSLTAIPTSPAWTANFTNPDTGGGTSLPNLAVAANTLILYAGGRDMSGNQVGEAGPGTPSISLSRGQGTVTGALAEDFATWGGSIAFDTLNNGSPRNWHFGIFTPPGPGQVDFLTIAFHELAHVFGFGTAASFDNLITANQFQGAAVVGLMGSAAALATGNDHWASGTTSPPYADEPAAALTASLILGRRTALTPLDYAAIKDVGWQVPNKLLGLHGDMNGDGDVDGRDFLAWQRGKGDADGNLISNQFDLWLWQQNHGRQFALQTLADSIQVPEPRGLILGCVVVLLFWRPHGN
ncbi:MAG: hypothetical protein SH868_08530 [Bythopirellula sp.]|nr:hypothetical protein [Bythopirellula sp.]